MAGTATPIPNGRELIADEGVEDSCGYLRAKGALVLQPGLGSTRLRVEWEAGNWRHCEDLHPRDPKNQGREAWFAGRILNLEMVGRVEEGV